MTLCYRTDLCFIFSLFVTILVAFVEIDCTAICTSMYINKENLSQHVALSGQCLNQHPCHSIQFVTYFILKII